MEVSASSEAPLRFCVDFPHMGPLLSPYVTIYLTMRQENLNCSMSTVNDTLPNGVNITSVVVDMKHLRLYPDFRIQLNFSIVDGAYEKNYGSPSASFGEDFIVKHTCVVV